MFILCLKNTQPRGLRRLRPLPTIGASVQFILSSRSCMQAGIPITSEYGLGYSEFSVPKRDLPMLVEPRGSRKFNRNPWVTTVQGRVGLFCRVSPGKQRISIRYWLRAQCEHRRIEQPSEVMRQTASYC